VEVAAPVVREKLPEIERAAKKERDPHEELVRPAHSSTDTHRTLIRPTPTRRTSFVVDSERFAVVCVCACVQLRNEPEGWWADAVRRAQHLPVRSSHSTNIDMKIELLRLNPQLREEMAERAAALLMPRDGGSGGGGGAGGGGAEGGAAMMTPRVEYVLLEEKLQRIQARADDYKDKRISVLLAKQQIEHQEVGICFFCALKGEPTASKTDVIILSWHTP